MVQSEHKPPRPPSSKGDRDNRGKFMLSMILEAPHALDGIAAVLEFGATKYSRSNWKKGLPVTEIIDSMLRHQMAYLNGEDHDPESHLPHVDHIACNALFLAEMGWRNDMDDRPVLISGSVSAELDKFRKENP
jgi:hypothetical protein